MGNTRSSTQIMALISVLTTAVLMPKPLPNTRKPTSSSAMLMPMTKSPGVALGK